MTRMKLRAEVKRVPANIRESVAAAAAVITLEVTSPGCLTTGGPRSPGRSGGSAFALLRARARALTDEKQAECHRVYDGCVDFDIT